MHDQKPKAKDKETLIKSSVRPEPVEGYVSSPIELIKPTVRGELVEPCMEDLISVTTKIARGLRVIGRLPGVKR